MNRYPLFLPAVLTVMIICMHVILLPAQTIDLSKPVGTPAGQSGVGSAGGSTYRIPISLLPAAGGFRPEVELVYNSQGGDGIAGWGWSLSCFSVISRAGRDHYYNGITGPVKFTNTNDAFLLDGQRMFVVSGTNGANGAVHGLENEQFSRLESFGGSETLGPDWFRVSTQSGLVLEYGHDLNTKMTANDGSNSNMLWFLNKITDRNGNYYRFLYTISTANRTFILSEIQYTGNSITGQLPANKVVFTYATRTGWQNNTIYEAGASLRTAHYLTNITVRNAASQAIRTFDLYHQVFRDQYFLKTFTEKGATGTGLNPLVFSYGANTTAAELTVSVPYGGMNGGNLFGGDFNGDGHQDLLSANYYYDNNNIPHYTSYEILKDFLSYGGGGSFLPFYEYNIPQTGAVELKGTSNGYYNFLTYDYDGDGKEDALLVNTTVSGGNRIFNGIRINYSRRYASPFIGPNYDSVSYLSIPHSPLYVQDFKYVYKNGSNFGSFFVPGDFDGDGAQDYILILGINPGNSFKAFFSSPAKGIINEEIAQFGVEGTPSDPFYASSVASASQLTPIDIDGDGRQEILVVKGTQSHVVSVSPAPSTTGFLYAATVVHSFPYIKTNYPCFPGDFNGDGKTDLLYRNTAFVSTGTWYVLISYGKSYNSYPFTFANRPYLPGDGGGSAHHLLVADLNGDGRSDIWHSLDLSSSSSRHTVYYSNGVSFVPAEHHTQSVSTNGSELANTVTGDFNGDGKADIMGVNNSSVGRFIYPQPFREDRLLTRVFNGLGAQEGFVYGLTNDGAVCSRSGAFEYDVQGIPFGTGPNGHPYNVLSTPIYVVKEAYRSNGIGTLNYTYYNYMDPASHRIRGFLGFGKMSVADDATSVHSVTESIVQPELLVPHVIRQYRIVYPDTISMLKVSDTLKKLSTVWTDKRYVHQVLKTTMTDWLTGAATETINTYDDYGNITRSILKKGSLSGTVFTAVETDTTTTAYGVYGTPFPASPLSVTEKKVRGGQAVAARLTSYTYTAAGLVATKVDFDGKPKATTTVFTYDSYGNLTKTDLSAAGLSTRTQKFVYDATGLFQTEKETVGTGISKKELTTYDALFGLPATVTSSDGLVNSYQYDAFGRVASITVPEGYAITHTLSWESSSARYSLNITRPGGGQNIKTWYDILQREERSERSGYNGETLYTFRSYNAAGQETYATAPFYGYEMPRERSTQYDNYGRISQVSNGITFINYTYTKLSGGQCKITTTTEAGKTSSRTQDAAGKIISATDDGGTLLYTYDSQGNQTQATLNGIIVQTAAYDDYGNHIQQTEKNAGTVEYEYDAYGQLLSQTNPLGQTTTMAYDLFGRLTSRTGPEGTTLFEYWQELPSGYCNDNPVTITGFGGEIRSYAYDNFRRRITESIQLDGNTYTTQNWYDTYGNPVKTSYPSGLVITRTFEHNGNVTLVKRGEGGSATTLFTGGAMTGQGKHIYYTYGNGKYSSLDYDPWVGLLTQAYAPGVQNLSFVYDWETGNLSSREDVTKNLEETFTYDNLDRLLTTGVNNLPQLSLTYDGSSGSSLGNITAKTDAGNYVYNNQKINAVAYVTNPAGALLPPAVIAQAQQDITYTAFGKADTIRENNYELAYRYGSDYQRIKSVLKQGGVTLETKYYLGGYEKQVKGGITRQLHYIHADDVLCAIIVVEGGTSKIYYTYTDHLGSITTVTDSVAAIVTRQSFDAWGRMRDTANWGYSNVPGQPDWLYRGYTGHEYLKEFALVNMNGRLYDPVLGRMLSPDNYTQEPFSTQSYNKYAYTINNPLKYTDPSGDFFLGTALTAIFDFFRVGFTEGGFEFWNWGKPSFNSAWREFDPTRSGSRTYNAFRIDIGRFKTDPHRNPWGQALQLFSRFTWESLQMGLGNLYSHFRNVQGSVTDVAYYGGATLVNRKKPGRDRWGLTLGSYINSVNLVADPFTNQTFRHEYGHTLQSMLIGPLYLTSVGIPSFIGSTIEGVAGHQHNTEWYEVQASRMAYDYFDKYHKEVFIDANGGIGWDEIANPRKYKPTWFWLFASPPPGFEWWLIF